MKIAKVKDVKTPSKGTEFSAGIDFYVPNTFPGTHYMATSQSIQIASGIHAKVPKGYALVFFNRSSVAVKKGLQVGACMVDEDYQGEIFFHLTNVSYEVAEINPGDKIIQGVLIPINYLDSQIEELESLELLYPEKTERGDGALGSTDEK